MSSHSSFNIHNALYTAKYTSRAAGGPRVEDPCSRRNGKRGESSRQKKISYDRQHYDKWTDEDTKSKVEKGEECRMLSSAVKDLPLGRTL